MSQINQKKTQIPPTFGPLNNRKGQTVGKTYGERRQKPGIEGDVTDNWMKRSIQGVRDFFSGGVGKTNNVQQFAHQTDRYETVRSNTPAAKMSRLEGGSTPKAKHPSNEKYVGFLNSVIQYLDAKKKV